MPNLILIIALSYLLGSIPFGYILVRLIYGEDVRRTGSGNIGATNVSRKSRILGVITLILDALKGTFAVMLAARVGTPFDAPPPYHLLSLAALLAVVGHMFPLWLRFRGGKGVATALGSFVMLAPKAVLVAAVVFILIVAISRYISLGSIISVGVFPLAAWRLREYGNAPISLLFMSLASVLIIAKHHANIRRLLSGTENRFGAKHA